jgi:hypothetical protein
MKHDLVDRSLLYESIVTDFRVVDAFSSEVSISTIIVVSQMRRINFTQTQRALSLGKKLPTFGLSGLLSDE